MKQDRNFWLVVSITIGVIGVCFLFGQSAHAAWTQIMYETFEQPATLWSNNGTGPWWQPPQPQLWSRQWQVRPNHPWQNFLPPHWGIQNRVYVVDPVHPEQYVQAAWCDASTDDAPINGAGRDPEFATYRGNLPIHTIMYWGPIDLTNYANMRCQFKWICSTIPGDTFSWEVSPAAGTGNQPIDPAYYPTHWFKAVYLQGDSLRRGAVCGDFTTWQPRIMRVDSVDSAGRVISMAHRPAVWFGWRFKSTNTAPDSVRMTHKGAFVDNVQIALDDGRFYFNSLSCNHIRARDTMPLIYPQVLDTLRFYYSFGINGSGILRDSAGRAVSAHVRCTINNAPFWDTLVPVNAGAENMTYRIFSPSYIPRVQGMYYIRWNVDTNSAFIFNGACIDSFNVIRPNSPPVVRFISLQSGDTIHDPGNTTRPGYFPIVVNVFDEDDSAAWYMYISQDSTLGTGAPLTVTPPFPWYSHNPTRNDTVWVDVSQFPMNSVWYFSIFATDIVNDPVWAKPRGCFNTDISTPERISYLPMQTSLYNTYPNPFNNEVTFKIGLAERAQGELRIFDIMGRDVGHLRVPGTQPGWYTVQWKANGLPSGVYFAQFIAGGRTITTAKLMYLK